MPTYASPEDVEREAELYDETVLLFAVLERAISEAGLECQIEPKLSRPDGSECRPDIIVEEENLNTIIEHKASLSDEEMNIINVFGDVLEKYAPLLREEMDDQLAILFPNEDSENVSLISHMIQEDLLFSTFVLKHEPRKLILKTIRGLYLSQDLRELMDGEIEYDFREFAKYKLIRARAPTPLAADIVWNMVLLPLYGRFRMKRDENVLSYDRIVDDAASLIKRRNRKVDATATDVVKDALAFLSEIQWVEYQSDAGTVQVRPEKSKRIGEIRKWFCQKWYDMKKKEEKQPSSSMGEEQYEQLSLLENEDNED